MFVSLALKDSMFKLDDSAGDLSFLNWEILSKICEPKFSRVDSISVSAIVLDLKFLTETVMSSWVPILTIDLLVS